MGVELPEAIVRRRQGKEVQFATLRHPVGPLISHTVKYVMLDDRKEAVSGASTAGTRVVNRVGLT